VPALDGVRGLAISFVMLRHGWGDVFGAGGFVGVELFFVLSGFLITGVLLRDINAGRVSYARFYYNRALRLFPALLLIVCVIATVALVHPHSREPEPPIAEGVISALTYMTDIPGWPLAQFRELPHLWTLAIEEQFYLLWPVFLVGLVRRGTVQRRVALALLVSGALLLASVAYRLHPGLYGRRHADLTPIYTWPTTWAATLMLGCAFAVGVVRPRVGPLVGGLGVAGLALLSLSTQAKTNSFGYLVVLPAGAVLGLLVIANATSRRPTKLLMTPGLRYLGTISYGAYLWNYPLSLWLGSWPGLGATLVVASLSYWCYERFFLRLKRPSAEPVPTAVRLT
jgi:peptidoglycan/LPS O-acetylase OafA/YrhL